MQRRRFLFATAGLLSGWGWAAAPAAARVANEPPASAEWEQLRGPLFGKRPIATSGPDLPLLEAPARAEDAATVPVVLRSAFDQSADRYVKTMTLVIDRNPSPVAAIFRFTPHSGRAEVATRVRIEQYTFVRVIAELNDGSLHMASRFVKAAGGCSAPAGKDPAAAAANLGQLRLRAAEGGDGGPRWAQLMIRHPNTSGLAMDQLTRLYAKPDFVRQLTVRYREPATSAQEQEVLSADLTFSISENPNFRFRFLPGAGGELVVQVVDTENRQFAGKLAIAPPPASSDCPGPPCTPR